MARGDRFNALQRSELADIIVMIMSAVAAYGFTYDDLNGRCRIDRRSL